ncbi:putative peptidase C1-like protein F26E4.3 [Hypsibius exemplaris]|uniref:Peptidase C1-like protein F26E4.3 n=1 Tax=Hypsibius exemplaris TaxID=2072580 RepID=A0A9X6RK15_HYPEX|nr:putative peptidase C1-like protein F26E4.3 [Hypsibius exemplaris]
MGIPGSFCSTLRETCCTDRNDRCSVPVQGTECYCDDFCDRRADGQVPDCCSDFYVHCRGESPPVTTTTAVTTTEARTLPPPRVEKGCWKDGTFHSVGTALKENCNQCVCQAIDRDLDDPRANSDQAVFEFHCDNHVCLIQDDLVQRVNTNSESYRWTAFAYPFFLGLTLAEGYRYRLGTFKPDISVTRMHEIRIDRNAILPDRFDARERWPGLIHPVGDQGNCAASWAFSTAELASDRLAIMTRGEMVGALSIQHLLSCNRNRQKGCQGGHLDRAWWFLHRKTGIVSANCYPYVGEAADKEDCPLRMHNQTAVVQCPSGADERHLWQMTPPYRIASNELEIKYEISTNGPVQAVLRVAPDFFSYKSGVYQSIEQSSPTDPTENYHSVRIIGWGSDHSATPPVPYWLCTNSWSSEWGENGTFRIKRGQNEAEIESFIIGVWGKKRSNDAGHLEASSPQDLTRRKKRTHNKRLQMRERKINKVVQVLDKLFQ